jgi:hypothetical protein
MSQREFWEERINEAFDARRQVQEKASAKAKAVRAARIAKELGVDKDLKSLDRMEVLRKSVTDRLEKSCRERGIQCYFGPNDPKRYLDALASQTADPAVKSLEKERQGLLSCLNKAVGAAELRAAIAEIENALAGMEDPSKGNQPDAADQTDNGDEDEK